MKINLFIIISILAILISSCKKDDKNKSNPNLPPFVCGQTIIDIDGNIYNTINIGSQCWMLENLKTTHYNDGTTIPNTTANLSWKNLRTGGFCFYENDTSNNAMYGKLYNWYAVNTNKLSPTGWHIPSNDEWNILIEYLGGFLVAGAKMKTTTLWNPPNIGTSNSSNSSGFTGIPAGDRFVNGTFASMGFSANFWTTTDTDSSYATSINLNYDGPFVYNIDIVKGNGLSIRCIKN